MFHDRRAPSRSLFEIEDLANKYRALEGVVTDEGWLDVNQLLFALNVKLMPKSDKEMGAERAYADATHNEISCRRSISRDLRFGHADARYCILHEVGHIAMHRGPELKALKIGGNRKERFISEEESEELQAWRFARAVAIPREHLDARSDDKIAEIVGLPIHAVALRRKEVRDWTERTKKKHPIAEVDQFVLRGKLGPHLYAVAKEAWDRAGRFAGHDPSLVRSARGFRIDFGKYGDEIAQTGWCVHNGEARSLMDLRTK